jgi:hypothetical protein
MIAARALASFAAVQRSMQIQATLCHTPRQPHNAHFFVKNARSNKNIFL